MSKSFTIRGVGFGQRIPRPHCRPCVIESRKNNRYRRAAVRLAKRLDIPLVFKASYDKANRTDYRFSRSWIRKRDRYPHRDSGNLSGADSYGVHSAEEIRQIGKAVDILQLPAF